MSDYWSEIQPELFTSQLFQLWKEAQARGSGRAAGCGAREFSEPTSPEGEFLSVTHKRLSSCELSGLRFPVIIF